MICFVAFKYIYVSFLQGMKKIKLIKNVYIKKPITVKNGIESNFKFCDKASVEILKKNFVVKCLSKDYLLKLCDCMDSYLYPSIWP